MSRRTGSLNSFTAVDASCLRFGIVRTCETRGTQRHSNLLLFVSNHSECSICPYFECHSLRRKKLSCPSEALTRPFRFFIDHYGTGRWTCSKILKSVRTLFSMPNNFRSSMAKNSFGIFMNLGLLMPSGNIKYVVLLFMLRVQCASRYTN